MGFLDQVGKAIKETGQGIAKEIDRRQQIANTKKRILSRFEMNELKNICKSYGIGDPPLFVEDMITGEKHKEPITRERYINRIMNKLTLDEIKNFSEKHRIRIHDVIESETPIVKPIIIKERVEPKEEIKTEEIKRVTEKDEEVEKLQKIISTINDFTPKKIFRKEAEYESTLFTRLETFFPDVEYQVPYANSRIDIKIGSFGIEIKNHPDQNEINRLLGQIISFKRFFKHIIVVIFNPRDLKPIDYLKSQISELNLPVTVIKK
jgi:hypothetical protein